MLKIALGSENSTVLRNFKVMKAMRQLIQLSSLGGLVFLGFMTLWFAGYFRGDDKYLITWNVPPDTKLYGSYTIEDINGPAIAQDIKSTLPYEVQFSAPPKAIVAAAGISHPSETVTITIYRNGSVCSKPLFTGNLASSTCPVKWF